MREDIYTTMLIPCQATYAKKTWFTCANQVSNLYNTQSLMYYLKIDYFLNRSIINKSVIAIINISHGNNNRDNFEK